MIVANSFVPEPRAMTLLGIGAMKLIVGRRRRRRDRRSR
jgi:hypothetical protein